MLNAKERMLDLIDELASAITEFKWNNEIPFVFENIQHPITHKAIDLINKGNLFCRENLTNDDAMAYIAALQKGKIFLINRTLPEIVDHDSFYGDCEIMLPFPITLFELSGGGMRLICIATQVNGGKPQYCFLALNKSEMVFPLDLKKSQFAISVQKQIETICILLDSEVAEYDVIRAPVELNKKREKYGKQKIADFYCINISNRKRYSQTKGSRSAGVRLHFRRGHWRHFETHKTWVKWHLVGDKDIGIVEKGYRL